MTSAKGLSQAAARLKHAAPAPFDDFVKALITYSSDITVAVTNARADEILCAQGNAQMARKLVQLMIECDFPVTPNKPMP